MLRRRIGWSRVDLIDPVVPTLVESAHDVSFKQSSAWTRCQGVRIVSVSFLSLHGVVRLTVFSASDRFAESIEERQAVRERSPKDQVRRAAGEEENWRAHPRGGAEDLMLLCGLGRPSIDTEVRI